METTEMFGEVSVSGRRCGYDGCTANHNIGHCYLMMDDLQQAYSAYQQALYHLRDPKVGRRIAIY